MHWVRPTEFAILYIFVFGHFFIYMQKRLYLRDLMIFFQLINNDIY